MTALIANPALGYDVYDLAYLAGGPHHVVDTALVALAETGRVRAQVTGELHALDLHRRSPVEAAVLDALGPRPRHSAATVRWRLETDERITSIGERLLADGLLSGRRRRLCTGGRPRPALTREGRRALRALRSDPPADRVAPATSAMLVALAGVRVMPDAALRAALFEPPTLPRRNRGLRCGGYDGILHSPGSWWAGGGIGGGDIGGCGGGWAAGGGWGGDGGSGGCGADGGGGGSC